MLVLKFEEADVSFFSRWADPCAWQDGRDNLQLWFGSSDLWLGYQICLLSGIAGRCYLETPVEKRKNVFKNLSKILKTQHTGYFNNCETVMSTSY